jgi:8-oxo-dGTP pyrophosphatase MutT (NUDIX family)
LEVKGFDVIADQRLGEGGHLRLRRMRLRLVLSDGSRTSEGSWDYVERPMGLDAVVLALFRQTAGAVEVLLRHGVRIPVHFGRPDKPPTLLFPELVAGILEPGDDLYQRAAAEAMEEAGLQIQPTSMRMLGPAVFPTPGMCAEVFQFVACEVDPHAVAHPAAGDGSPFEQGARIEWVPLDEALSRCSRGEIRDMKTEIGLRRLREKLGSRGALLTHCSAEKGRPSG